MRFQKVLNAVIVFLRTQQAILVVLILALLAQLPHTAWVFHRISTTPVRYPVAGFDLGALYGWLLAYVAATSVELAVLMFVVRGRELYSWVFAACSVLMNLFYYWQPTWSLWEVPYPVSMYSALLWSLLLPFAIALYSHEIERDRTHHPAKAPASTTADTTASPVVMEPLPVLHVPPPNGHITPDLVPFATAATASLQDAVQPSRPTRKPKPAPQAVADTGNGRVADVMQLTWQGKSNKEIAALLGITTVTVRGYQAKYRKEQREIEATYGTTNQSTHQEQAGGAAHAGTREKDRQAPESESAAAPVYRVATPVDAVRA